MTVHSWLHVPDFMENTGPLWGVWCWIMERFCGRLGRAVSSRKHPFASINRRIFELQTLFSVRNLFGLHEALPNYSKMHNTAGPSIFYLGIESSYREVQLTGKAKSTSISNKRSVGKEANSLRDRIAVHLCTQWDMDKRDVKQALPETIVQWSKIILYETEIISTVEGDKRKEANLRDSTWVKYELLEDQNEEDQSASINFEPQIFFGQALRAFVCTVPAMPAVGIAETRTAILVEVKKYKHSIDKYGINYYNKSCNVSTEIIDATSLRALVGRIEDRGVWAFVERQGGIDHAEYQNTENVSAS